MKPFQYLLCFLLLWGSGAAAVLAAERSDVLNDEGRLNHLADNLQIEEEKHLNLLRHADLESVIEKVRDRLWAVLEADQPSIVVKVVQESLPDAYTYPNGVVYLTTGMLTRTRSEDQLAMILSHEIIHYIRRHALTAFKRLRPASTLGQPDARTPVENSRIEHSLTIWREAAEQQADQEGLALMRLAGYCASEVNALLVDLEKISNFGNGPRSLLSFRAATLRQRQTRLNRLLSSLKTRDGCTVPEDRRRSYLDCLVPVFVADTQTALAGGRLGQAAMDLQRLMDLRPNDARVHFLLGELEIRRDDRQQQAIACFETAIGLDNLYAPAYRALGVIHFKAGELDRARQYFETSLLLAPNDAENEFIREYLKQCRH